MSSRQSFDTRVSLTITLFEKNYYRVKLAVVYMAHMVGSQSERSKFGLDQSESRISPMWLIDVTTIVLAHVTPPEVTPQSPGSDRATGSHSPPEVTPPVHRKWLYNRKSLSSPPEVTVRPEVTVSPEVPPSPPEVTARPEVKKNDPSPLSSPQTPGSECATGSDFPDPRSDCATGSHLATSP